MPEPSAFREVSPHDTPFERVIKICEEVRLGRLMCGKALPFRESQFFI